MGYLMADLHFSFFFDQAKWKVLYVVCLFFTTDSESCYCFVVVFSFKHTYTTFNGDGWVEWESCQAELRRRAAHFAHASYILLRTMYNDKNVSRKNPKRSQGHPGDVVVYHSLSLSTRDILSTAPWNWTHLLYHLASKLRLSLVLARRLSIFASCAKLCSSIQFKCQSTWFTCHFTFRILYFLILHSFSAIVSFQRGSASQLTQNTMVGEATMVCIME